MSEFFFFRWWYYDTKSEVAFGYGIKDDGCWYCRCVQFTSICYFVEETIMIEKTAVPVGIYEEYANLIAL